MSRPNAALTREEQRQLWREKTVHNRSPGEVARRVHERTADKERALASATTRDPCTFCGIRADIGCKHNRRDQIKREARLFGTDAILSDRTVVDQAWDREIELARIEGQGK